jgi:hypothetical protein
MPTLLTAEELRARFTGMKKSLIYEEAVKKYSSLRIHADGDVPIKLIKKARPNESEEVRAYREEIYETETQNPVERVLAVLEKIRRSPDWMMRYDFEVPAIIAKEEALACYLENKYPIHKSFENWLFDEALKAAGIDANAVIAIIPNELDIKATEYLKPVATIFHAKNVIDFVADDFAILKSDELSSLLPPDVQQQRLAAVQSAKENAGKYAADNGEGFTAGQVYYVITTQLYQKWEETKEGKYSLTKQYLHGLNELPAFQMPGRFVKRVGPYTLKRTPLAPMVSHLNKAARESNDLDAGVIMHLFLEKWRINNVPCGTCKGAQNVPGGAGTMICPDCKGSGMATGKSPFNEVVIKPAAIGQQNIPTPPLGYVVKDPKIIELQDQRIEKHIYKALQAVNMDHLAEVQMNQSGVAKQYDRDEVNTTITTFAEMLCYIANTCIYFFNELRYRNVVADPEERKKLLPIIPVPEKFDVINSTFLITEYQTSKTAGLNSIILAELQMEIASKKFYANPKIASFVRTVMELDPFPDKTIEEKGAMESQGLATKEDIILSNYISSFVKQAQETDEKFNEKTLTEKKEILLKLAKVKVDELNKAKKLMAEMVPPGTNPDDIPDDEEEDDLDTGGDGQKKR